MPWLAWACAITVLPAARASYTRAAISSGENPVAPGSSLGDMTPPLVCTLIWSAPARSTSRVARRTPSTPSTTVNGSSDTGRMLAPLGMTESPWPPVCDNAETAMRMRGPGNKPWSMAILTPRGVPAASRTVVKPASRVIRA